MRTIVNVLCIICFMSSNLSSAAALPSTTTAPDAENILPVDALNNTMIKLAWSIVNGDRAEMVSCRSEMRSLLSELSGTNNIIVKYDLAYVSRALRDANSYEVDLSRFCAIDPANSQQAALLETLAKQELLFTRSDRGTWKWITRIVDHIDLPSAGLTHLQLQLLSTKIGDIQTFEERDKILRRYLSQEQVRLSELRVQNETNADPDSVLQSLFLLTANNDASSVQLGILLSDVEAYFKAFGMSGQYNGRLVLLLLVTEKAAVSTESGKLTNQRRAIDAWVCALYPTLRPKLANTWRVRIDQQLPPSYKPQ